MTGSDVGPILRGQVDAATPSEPPGWGDVLARRRRRRRRRMTFASGVVSVLTFAAVGVVTATGPSRHTDLGLAAPVGEQTTATDAVSPGPDSARALPPVPRVEPGDQPPEPLVLTAEGWTPVEVTSTCWQHTNAAFCADGIASPPYIAARPGRVATFAFPLDGWTFEASAQALPDADGAACTRYLETRVTADGEAFHVEVLGPAGRYLVGIVGRGPQGSVAASFVLTATTGASVPPAEGYLALLTDLDGTLGSYGVELGATGLDRGYPDATVRATVTAADGSSETYGPYADGDSDGCDDGSVFITSPSEQPWPTPDLGPGPYRYRVELVLDGTTYVGTAVWPRDQRADEAPNTDLRFVPPLPRFTGG